MSILMNMNESVPDTFYIFVNQVNSITQHNLRNSGQFISSAFGLSISNKGFREKYIKGEINYPPFTINKENNIHTASPFGISHEYGIEYNCECYRYIYHPTYPSRFSGIFALDSIEVCKKVSAKYRWPLDTVKRFRLLDDPLNRVIKADMEIISAMRTASRIGFFEQTEENKIWRSYWNGISNNGFLVPFIDGDGTTIIKEQPIWEFLIEGCLELIN